MVDVKFSLGKRDFAWIGLIVILVGVGFVYGYGGSSPALMGHSSGEVVVDNALCNAITGYNCGTIPAGAVDTNAITLCPNDQFLDGDGSCLTAAQIATVGGGSGLYICIEYQCYANCGLPSWRTSVHTTPIYPVKVVDTQPVWFEDICYQI